MNATTIQTMITSTETALAAALANPAPNYSVSGPDGSQSMSFADYIKMLTEELKALSELQNIATPYWVESRVIL